MGEPEGRGGDRRKKSGIKESGENRTVGELEKRGWGKRGEGRRRGRRMRREK